MMKISFSHAFLLCQTKKERKRGERKMFDIIIRKVSDKV